MFKKKPKEFLILPVFLLLITIGCGGINIIKNEIYLFFSYVIALPMEFKIVISNLLIFLPFVIILFYPNISCKKSHTTIICFVIIIYFITLYFVLPHL